MVIGKSPSFYLAILLVILAQKDMVFQKKRISA